MWSHILKFIHFALSKYNLWCNGINVDKINHQKHGCIAINELSMVTKTNEC